MPDAKNKGGRPPKAPEDKRTRFYFGWPVRDVPWLTQARGEDSVGAFVEAILRERKEEANDER